MKYEFKFTVCTPTYNRANTLQRLYNSLLNQTFKNFEWIIVDDGSSDNTKAIVDAFIKENIINIQYYYKENGGKHRAINYGVQFAKGELFAIVDSDDFLDQKALEIINTYHIQYPNYELFISLDQDLNGKVIGDYFPNDLKISNINKLFFYLKIKGDKWIIPSTKLMKEFPFKEYKNEKFIAESSVWQKISIENDIIIINEPLLIVEYQINGLSSNTVNLRKNNPQGTNYLYNNQLDYKIPTLFKIKAAINIYRFTFNTKLFSTNLKKIKIFFTIISLPLGICLYFYDKR